MDNLKTWEFGADAPTLKDADESGQLPESWEGVFRTLVTEIATMVKQKPRSIYLCSSDEDAGARNHFGFILARLLRERVPGVLLVDCDFLAVGLSGIVPHRDALGFLDLLLYGTSLGVIAQEASHGAKVVGAGSFAVTRKNPFAADSFAAARRYLVNQAGCVLFVGPALDDEEGLHPIAQNVDLVALVRTGDRFDTRVLDPLEGKIAAVPGVEGWSVRLNTWLAAGRAGEGEGGEPTLVAQAEEPVDRSRPEGAAARVDTEGRRPAPSAPRPPEPARPTVAPSRGPAADDFPGPRTARGRASASRVVRIIASLAAVFAVVFVVWWLYLTRSVRDRGEGPHTPGPASVTTEAPAADSSRVAARVEGPAGAGSGADAGGDREAVDGTETKSAAETSAAGETTASREAATERPPVGAGAARALEGLSTADSIAFFQTLDEFAGRYVIHVSSFRGTERATNEAYYLVGWGYPVFVYDVDLGSKGMWYRVYVGPYATREEAMDVKIKLDENPRIKSTRVSKVPG